MTKEEKQRIKEIAEAMMKGYRLAQKHYKEYGKFMGNDKKYEV